MLDFLSQITDFFSAIGSFLLNVVHGLIFLVSFIPAGMQWLVVVFGYLPVPFLAFAMATVSVCIVYLLLGR